MFIRPCKAQPVKRAVLVAALVCVTASASLAAAERRQFEVAAGSAAQSLNEFSRQAEIQLLFDSDAVRSLHTHAVFGELDAAEALGRMLVGTDLVFEFVNERTVAVMRRGASQHTTPSTSATGQAGGTIHTPVKPRGASWDGAFVWLKRIKERLHPRKKE